MAWQDDSTKSLVGFLHTDTNYVTNGATCSYQFDTLGYRYAEVDVILSGAGTTSQVPTIVVLSETDTTTTSTAGDIIAFTGKTQTATSVGFLIPTNNFNTATGAANVYRYNLNLLPPRKRYLTVRVTPTTTCQVVVDARLGKPATWLISAAGEGVNALVEG